MRASDSDRERAVARLSAGYAAGRLGPDTLVQRVDLAYRAGSRDDLHALTADLPGRLRSVIDGWTAQLRSLLMPAERADVPCVWLTPPDGGHGPWTIGRASESDMVIDDETVSRRHAELRWTPEGYALTDIGSLNGSRVNGVEVTTAVLRSGDELRVGQVRVRLSQRP